MNRGFTSSSALMTPATILACFLASSCQNEKIAVELNESPPPCTQEAQCAHLGPGSMCMAGMCMAMDTRGPSVQAVPPTGPIPQLHPLTDLDPDPDRFEARISARAVPIRYFPGQSSTGYAYVDLVTQTASVPGPLIDVAVGTEVVIHFTNELDEPTSIHWHGLRLPSHMDGVPDMPVPAIEPGESYTYRYTVLDPGLYWYHPHVRTDEQAERGLYGALVARGSDEPQVATERILILDDILLAPDGSIEPKDEGPAHVFENGQMSMSFVSMMGRQGNYLLVNGAAHPIIETKAGSVERWRLVNTSNARFFNVALSGHTFTVIGSDGGLFDQPYETDHLLISTAERLDVLVRMTGTPGTVLSATNHHFDRGHDLADPGNLPLFEVRYNANPAIQEPNPTYKNPTMRRLYDGIPNRTLVLGENLNDYGKVEFTFNDETWPMVPTIKTRPGAVEIWELHNETHMDHPFHLHGNFFQVTATAGEDGIWTPTARVELKDTYRLPGASSARIAVDFSGYRGHWSYHCHILEHAEAGMMGMITLEDDTRLCVPGQPRCEGNTLRVCNEIGTGHVHGRFCASGCITDSDGTGHCVPHCKVGQRRCIGREVQRCDEHGDTWLADELCEKSCVAQSESAAQCE
jgi:FtsP/CotA-like multicopper oxidase with cupredoxin domain